MAKKSYLSQFFKDSKEVGAVAPSSKSLGRKICSFIDFDKADVIVELGPGNGVFTKLLLERMKPGSKLLALETNAAFCNLIRETIKDDRLILVEDSAEHITKYLEQHGYHSCQYVVSSLPYTVFPSELKNAILDDAVKALNNDGMYLQFQYSLNAFKLLKSKFDKVNYTFSLLNFPPAFVYRCTFNQAKAQLN